MKISIYCGTARLGCVAKRLMWEILGEGDNGKKLRYFKMSKDLMSKIQIDACRKDDFEQILGLLGQL
jgi:hypothetical protein